MKYFEDIGILKNAEVFIGSDGETYKLEYNGYTFILSILITDEKPEGYDNTIRILNGGYWDDRITLDDAKEMSLEEIYNEDYEDF